MNNHGSEIKVGIFVLIGIIILAYMSLKVGKFDFGKPEGYEIIAYFDNVSGLNTDVPVEIAGIEVGRVKEIVLDQGKAKVSMRISYDTSIPSDSTASLRSRGLMGDKFIEIALGSPESPSLKNGEKVVHTRTPADIDQAVNKIGEVAGDISKVSKALGNALGGEQGQGDIRQVLENLKKGTETLSRIITENENNINSLLKNLNQFSKDLEGISQANKAHINRIIIDLKQSTAQLRESTSTFNNIAKKMERGEGTLGRLINDPSTLEELNQTLAHLKSITQKIDSGEGTLGRLISREDTGKGLDETVDSLKSISKKIDSGKGTLGRLINDEKIAENLEDTLHGINDYFTKTDAFKFDVDFHIEQLTRHNDIKSYLNLKIQPKADKYYLLGIVSDPSGLETTTDTRITQSPGGTRTIHEEKTEKDKLKFNAQIAKRYYDLVLRGGIIESTGGVGIDYYLLDDRLKLGIEAFDFSSDSDEKTHLKGYADFSFFKYLYLTAGFDDFISDQGESSFFIGAGLTFRDDDIKYLLTSAPIPGQ